MKRYLADCVLHPLFHGKIPRFIVIISVLLCSINAYAVTNNLPDCSQTTVQNAINSSSAGDVLVCPAGSWSWSDVNITKNITLQGAGIGYTNISITAAGGIESPTSYTGAFRVTGFTFTSTANFGTDGGYGMMRILGNKGFRVDHNRFEIYSNVESYNGGNGVYLRYDVAGLIDHNYFTKGGGTGCMHASVYPEGNANISWTDYGTQIGSPDHTVFIEDNEFFNPDNCTSHSAHCVYGQRGGIYVFRHNTVTNMNADSHGFCATYGTREYEISNNTFTATFGNKYDGIHLRGGTGVVYGNALSNFTNAYHLEDYRHSGGDGGCGGSETSNVPEYGNVTASSSCPEFSAAGYCAQQIGRGQNNSSDPLYIWGNTGSSSVLNNDTADIRSGQDYFMNQGAKPGYSAYTYPHPLQSGSEPPPPPPPPGNLIPNAPVISGVH